MAFPIKFTAPKVEKMNRKIVHRLNRKKGEYDTITVADRLKQFTSPENTRWHREVKRLKERGITFSRNERIQLKNVKIKHIVIDEDIQRALDTKHVNNIFTGMNFDVRFMAPILAVKIPGKEEYHCTDGQHTLVLEAAMARYHLWEDVDSVEEMEVPVCYIETEDRSCFRPFFGLINGKGKKKLDAYDEHRIEVHCYRLDNNISDPEYKQAHILQKICEDNGCEPIISRDIDNHGLPGTITHVSAMRKFKNKPHVWEFIVKMNRKYWTNLVMEGMEIDFYGFIYEYMTQIKGVDVYSKEFEKAFLNPIHAIIQKFFTIPKNLSEESAGTYKRWFVNTWSRDFDDYITVPAEATFVLMLKLYQKFGGTHPIPDVVDQFTSNKGDLIDFLPSNILSVINEQE